VNNRALAGGMAAAMMVLVAACGSKGDAKSEDDAATETLRLGASLSLTGSLAREGALTKEGYELCAKVINDKGGIPAGGKKLKLDIQYQDDSSKPDTAGQLVDQFNDKGIKLILGPYGSATTEAAAAVIERNGQVMMDSSGSDDKIFTKGYKRTFAVLAPASQYAASMVQAINDMAAPKPTTVAFISADDGFSKTVTKAGVDRAKQLGFQVTAEEYVANGTSDVSSALMKVKAKIPDVIIGSVHLAEGVAIVRQSAELGIKPKAGFAETVAPPVPDFAKSLGSLAEGVLGSTQWTKETAGKDEWFGTAADYNTTFTTQYGGRAPQYHNAQATAACLSFALAVKKTGSTDPARVRDAVAKLDEKTFFGSIKFNDAGQNVSKPMAVIQIQGGKSVSVWPKESAESAMKWPAVGA
jgi:branched-chain amino acid transport system substrate-binding protein